jgi:formate dehydrogenase subunit beta
MIERLRESCRRLLEEGTVQVVIGYGEPRNGGPAHPIFVTKPEQAAQLYWGNRCLANLTVYLTRKEVKALGKAAIVVKGCDERALVVLEKEAQVERGALHVIGMACDGVGEPLAPKCRVCKVRVPRFANEVIGEAGEIAAEAGLRPLAEPGSNPLAALMAKSSAERWEFWKSEFSRCVKCYACRQVCPLCYCERCIADKNRPVTIDTSASMRGNFAWHMTRAFHLAARCVGCGECTRICPAGIPLGLLNRSLAEAAASEFGYQAGMDPAAEPVLGAWSPADKEDFIK